MEHNQLEKAVDCCTKQTKKPRYLFNNVEVIQKKMYLLVNCMQLDNIDYTIQTIKQCIQCISSPTNQKINNVIIYDQSDSSYFIMQYKFGLNQT